MRAATILSGLATVALAAADLDPIIMKGSKFFYKTSGEQFFMKGIAYQQEATGNNTAGATMSGNSAYKDPLADADRCKIDIPLMQKLNTNTIRVYAIDPTKNHDVCMKLLTDAGIYIVADLSEPGNSINRNTPQWNEDVFERYQKVIDFYAKYTNTIGFFSGNEVSNSKNNTNASAFVKAATRDTKAYIKAKGYRQMYVGYATADDADIRADMAAYFNCGDQESAIDFWGYNIYSWCGDSSFTKSGFDQRVKEFSGYSVPTFFAEYGCNEVTPRQFTEAGAIYGPQMTPVFSGGIVYMWFQEENNYGLVDLQSNGQVKPRKDYDYLQKQMANVKPTGVKIDAYTPTNKPAACPAVVKGKWEAAASPLPPTPNKDLCKCMMNSLSCTVRGGVKQEAYGDIFGLVCGYGGGAACAGIRTDPITGKYGAYSMCNDAEKLSFALDQYYKSQQSRADACNFQGAAQIKQAVTPPSSCSALMSQAGPAGTGVVTSNPYGASVSGGNSTTKKSNALMNSPTDSHSLLGLSAGLAAAFGIGMTLL